MYKELIKKRINFRFSGQDLVFDVNQSLFSSMNVDEGTKILLNSLRKNKDLKYDKILDVGCGYGAIGIFLKKQNPEADITCVDRDALAIEFTQHNATLNSCKIKVYGSLGYKGIKDKFDLIVSNFPAKAGEKALKDFVYNASNKLNKNGTFTLVIVKELEEDFKKILNENIEISYQQKSSGYFIYHLKYKKKITFEEDSYYRGEIDFSLGGKNYNLKTAVNIDEFDTPNHSTMCILRLINEMDAKGTDTKEPVIIEPFQGHVAIGVMHYLKPERITLVSRDLLSLEYARNNIIENGFLNSEILHVPYLDKKLGDLVIWRIDSKEETKSLELKLNLLKKHYDRIIIAGKKVQLARLLKVKPREEFEIDGYRAVLID